MEQLNFVGTTYCGLCRLQFPSARVQGFDAWQSDFRPYTSIRNTSRLLNADTPTVLSFISKGGTSIEITKCATLSSLADETNVPLTGPPPNQTITISHNLRYSRRRRNEQIAFCFHDWCYIILSSRVGGCLKSVIYRLVRTLALEPSIIENMCQGRGQIDPAGSLQTIFLHTERFPSLQPPFMLKLPVELRYYIWEYVGITTAYRAFILVACETTRLAHSLNGSFSRKISLQQGANLSAKIVSAFGTEYVQDLGNTENFERDSGILGVVAELKFAASFHGICAIKISGVDWDTGWLGKIPDKDHSWYGRICGAISDLHLTYNDLNCTGISTPAPYSTSQILWDQSDIPPFSFDADAALFDFDRDFISSTRPDRTPQRRFFRYLPLFDGSEYFIGLTVYVSGNGIVGLEAHFTRTSRLSGSQQGCALHFPLHPRERIAYAWLRIVDSCSAVFAAPALAIQTSFGRVHLFGSHILPYLVVNEKYKWILLKKKGCVSGFYYENPTTALIITRLGITSDGTAVPDTVLMPQYATLDFPSPPIAGPNAGLFLSVALLSDVKRVEMCRVAGRCTGLLIHYINGLSTVFGQWHTSCASQHSGVYDSSGPNVDAVCFRMANRRCHQIVTDVSFINRIKVVPDSDSKVFSIGDHIAWWFSEFYDTISPWEGKYLDIPEGSKMLQK